MSIDEYNKNKEMYLEEKEIERSATKDNEMSYEEELKEELEEELEKEL